MVDGQTTVIATVNKKHEFKIVCKSLDLQTAKGTLKATGKVTISGDAFNGTCEHLAIPLDGRPPHPRRAGAAVTIQKLTSTVSDTKPVTFELKGETLNLGISELQRGEPFQQMEHAPRDRRQRKANDRDRRRQAVDGLRYAAARVNNEALANDSGVWQLHDSQGRVIATVLARVGGTLTQHEGQTISVFGNTELTRRPTLLASHAHRSAVRRKR